ncbi:O-succinylbenzoate synthase [Pendulispora rubella]|uniref:O-succinylbenzoate synthase n=1 Tax=Pendulispora rubella TaxID=2741070 RepID=A0ABZ2KV91_9BACT
MNLVITRADRYPFSFSHDGGNSRIHWNQRGGMVLRVCERDGAVGLGEASPLPGYSRDTLEACERDLERFAASLPTALADPIDATIPRLLDACGVHAPAARFAIETALLDVVARVRGLPVWAVLRGADAARPLKLSAVIDDPADASRAARSAIERGIRTLKAKVGRAGRFDEELAALHGLRGLGPLALRADANGAWTGDEAAQRLERMRPLGLEFVEEPCPIDDWSALAGCGVAIAADESLQTDHGLDAALRLAGEGICRVFVLKPTALGGALRCLHIADRVRAAGAEVVVTHMFEGPIAHAASVELALALSPGLACGLDAAPHQARWPRWPRWPGGTLVRLTDSEIIPNMVVGLGVDVPLGASLAEEDP